MKYLILTLLTINLVFTDEKTENKDSSSNTTKTYVATANKVCGPDIEKLDMSEEDFKEKMKEKVKETTSQIAGAMKDNAQVVNDYAKSDGGKELLTEVKKGDKAEFQNEPSENLKKNGEKLLKDVDPENQEKLDEMKTKFEDIKTSLPDCMEVLSQAQVGTLCKIHSEEGASDLKDSGEGKTFAVNTEDASKIWDKCSSLVDPMIQAQLLEDLSESAVEGKETKKSGRNKKVQDLATLMEADENCIADKTKCSDSVKNKFAEIVIVVGNKKNSMFSEEAREERRNKVKERKNKSVPKKGSGDASGDSKTNDTKETTNKPADSAAKRARILIARFLEEAGIDTDSEVDITISSSADSVVAIGAKSGFNTKTIWESARIIVTSLLAAYVAVIAK